MAQLKISGALASKPAAALDGTEGFFLLQAGEVKGGTAQQIADFAGGGAETFLGLTDTPAGYASSANFAVRVNGAETALEFVDLNTLYAQLGSANVFTDVQTIESAAPEIVFSETDTTDQNWRLAAGGGVYSIQDINDSFVFIRNNISLTHGGGMQVGAPTGGDQGAGTVNATGLYQEGDPVAESGSNANGHWQKFADGTMRQRLHRLSLPFDAAATLAGTWTFPQEFIDTDYSITTVFIPPLDADGPNDIDKDTGTARSNISDTGSGNYTTTSVKLSVFRIAGTTDFQAGDQMYVTVIAEGRWKA